MTTENTSGSSGGTSSDSGSMSYTGPLSGSATASSAVGTATTIWPQYRGMEYEESEALKLALSWITLPDAKGAMHPVKVWFRLPEREQREVTYPNIVIDFLNMRERSEESHRGYVPFFYEAYTSNFLAPDNSPVQVEDNTVAWAEWPIPIALRYQITTSARNNQHDVMMNDILLTSVLPFRFGQLSMPSGTVRRLDVLQAQTDTSFLDADHKRVFRKVWTIEISSEVVFNYAYPAVVNEIILSTTYPIPFDTGD